MAYTLFKGLITLILSGCGPSTPIVKAHRDYTQFPEYAKTIALHNIQQIFSDGNNCNGGYRVDEEGVYCQKEVKGYLSPDGRGPGSFTTVHDQSYTLNLKWSEIADLRIIYNCLMVGSTNPELTDQGVSTRSLEQAQELKEAMEVYLGRR